MVPDVQQFCRIRDLAMRAGLRIGRDDPAEFAARYTPLRYREWQLPPAFVWLCTLCDPTQLSRIWIIAPPIGEPSPLQKWNDEARRGPLPWPEYLVVFGFTGDEQVCFAYDAPDREPAVVTVDGYSKAVDAEGEEYTDWDWYADSFEQWLAREADALPEWDAKVAAWQARRRDA